MGKLAKVAKTSATKKKKQRHKTLPIPSSITYIAGYPQKLFIYQLEASRYWWVRYFSVGKTIRKTTKTEKKAEAIAFAKQFFFDVGQKVVHGLPIAQTNFVTCAAAMLKAEDAKRERGELTKITYDNLQYRLDKLVLPHFQAKDVATIDYFALDGYLSVLSHHKPQFSISTITAYMGLVRKVLVYAARRGFIKAVPEFPHVAKEDIARGWFNTKEYHRLWGAATRYLGKTVEQRRWKNEKDEYEYQFILSTAPAKKKNGDLLRNIEMTEDMRRLIVFMANSYIRPTDIKFMQHKHVDVVRNEHTYLRLRIPTTKKHNKPIITMPKAVEVYETLKAYHTEKGQAADEDYVFLPQYKSRDYALKQLQRQFEVITWDTRLGKGADGEERTLYSLRHTCIMYRLLYGDSINTLLLARNARTGPDMIDRFYAKPLTGEMNVGILQSRRRKRKIYDGEDEVIQPSNDLGQKTNPQTPTDKRAEK
jgi:integrase